MKPKKKQNLLFIILTALLLSSCAKVDVDNDEEVPEDSADDTLIANTDDSESSGGGNSTDGPDTNDTGSDKETDDTVTGDIPDSETDTGPFECTPENAATICGALPCVDGYCCDASCDGICVACNIVSSEGICTFLTATEDPDSECEQTNEADCGLSGVCDGAGACAFYDTDVVCDDNKACTEDDKCDGVGECSGVAPLGCNPGPLNACCESACDDESGCYTVTGACEEICEAQRLVTNQECIGCGDAGAEGICTGGLSTECDAGNLCLEMQCGGTIYHCTNFESIFAWRTSVFCDDGNQCSWNDACISDRVCSGTTYTCTGDYCMDRQCDGQGGCTETAQNEGNDCDTDNPLNCPGDQCTGAGSTLSWSNYDETCTKTCEAGACTDCTCTPLETSCTAQGCCVVDCADATGCFTKPGSCGIEADICTADQLSITRACKDCGVNDAFGICDDNEGGDFSCSAVNACEIKNCEGADYTCTNASGSWQWLTSSDCNDADACTENDVCGGGGICVGTPKVCAAGGCCEATCDTDSGCSTQATACPDQCGATEMIVTQSCGGCGSEGGDGTCDGTHYLCEDSGDLCKRETCGGTLYYCTNIGGDYQWRASNLCTDNNQCTYGDYCDVSTPQCIPVGDMTLACASSDPCVVFSCNGTNTCSSANTFEACNDSDPCTYGDICDGEGNCDNAGTVTCDPTDCNNLHCDGSSTCVDDFVDSDVTCGGNSCSLDECTGTTGSETFHNYPDSCDGVCDGGGVCLGCVCPDNTTQCAVNASDECCESTCDSLTGCGSAAGNCDDVCGTDTLTLARGCTGCGAGVNDATGVCDGGTDYACSECGTQLCGGVTHYCVDNSGAWDWTVNPTCGDGCCNGAETSQTCTEDCGPVCGTPSVGNTCAAAGGCISENRIVTGNTTSYTSNYDIINTDADGNDGAWKVIIPDGQTMTATYSETSASSANRVLYLVTDCGSTNSSLLDWDSNADSATISHSNTSGGPLEAFLICDANSTYSFADCSYGLAVTFTPN